MRLGIDFSKQGMGIWDGLLSQSYYLASQVDISGKIPRVNDESKNKCVN